MSRRILMLAAAVLFITPFTLSAEMAPQFNKGANDQTDLSKAAPKHERLLKNGDVMESNAATLGGEVMESNAANKPGEVMENNAANKPGEVMENNAADKPGEVMENNAANVNVNKNVMENNAAAGKLNKNQGVME